MTIGVPLDRGMDGGNTTVSVGPFTPIAGEVLLAIVYGRRNASVPSQPVISDSLGGLWTVIGEDSYNPGSNPRVRARVFWQKIGGLPSLMTVSASVPNAMRVGMAIVAISGCDIDFSNFIFNNDINGDPSCALVFPPGAGSVVFGWAIGPGATQFTPTPGFTDLYDVALNVNTRLAAAYDGSSPPQVLSWTSLNNNSVGFAVEVKPATGGTIVNITAMPMTGSFGDPVVTGKSHVDLSGMPMGSFIANVAVNPHVGGRGGGTPDGLTLNMTL